MKRKEMASELHSKSPVAPKRGDGRLLLLVTGEWLLIAGVTTFFPPDFFSFPTY